MTTAPVWLESFQAADQHGVPRTRYRVAFAVERMQPGLDYRITVPREKGPREFVYRRSGKVVDVFM